MHVAILSFNHPELTHRATSSVLAHKEPREIHLVHNGSRAEVVKQLRENFPLVNHHQLSQNRGFSGGANFALQQAFKDCRWVLFITNDCELLSVTEVPSEPALVAPLIWRRKTGQVDSLGGRLSWPQGRLRHLRSAREWENSPDEILYVPGTAFLMHREVWSDVGGFDETLHTYWEDVDLSFRVHRRNWPLKAESRIQLRHGIGKTCHRDSFYTTFLYHRNRAIVTRRHCPKVFHRARLEGHLLYGYASLGLRHLRNRRWAELRSLGKAYWQALVWRKLQSSNSDSGSADLRGQLSSPQYR